MGAQGESDPIVVLLNEIDAAYARARAEVFDFEGPGADPVTRTLRQRRLVDELGRLEEALRLLREDRHRDV